MITQCEALAFEDLNIGSGCNRRRRFETGNVVRDPPCCLDSAVGLDAVGVFGIGIGRYDERPANGR
jgi:hypothetical protein